MEAKRATTSSPARGGEDGPSTKHTKAKISTTAGLLPHTDLQKLLLDSETDVAKNVELVRYLHSVTGFHKTLRMAIWGEAFDGDTADDDDNGGATHEQRAAAVPKELAVLFDAQAGGPNRSNVMPPSNDDFGNNNNGGSSSNFGDEGGPNSSRQQSSAVLSRDITTMPSKMSMADVRISHVTGVVDMSDPRLWDPPVPVISKSRQSRVLQLQRRNVVLDKQRSRFVAGMVVDGGVPGANGTTQHNDDDDNEDGHNILVSTLNGIAGAQAAYADIMQQPEVEEGGDRMAFHHQQQFNDSESSVAYLLSQTMDDPIISRQRRHSRVLPPLSTTLTTHTNNSHASPTTTTSATYITQREIAKKLNLNPDTHPDLKRVLRHQRRVLNKVLPHVVGDDLEMSAKFKNAATTGTMTSDHYRRKHDEDGERVDNTATLDSEDASQKHQQLLDDEEDGVVDHHLSTNTPLSTIASKIRSKRSDAYLHSISQGHRSYLNDADIDADMYTFHEGHLGADMGLFNLENRGVLVAPSQIMTSTAVALLQTQAAENRNDMDKYMLPVLTSDDLLLVKKESVLRALTVTPPLTSLSICRNFMLRHLPIELIHHVSESLLTLNLSFNQLQYLPLELLYKPASKNPYNRPQGFTLARSGEDKNNETQRSSMSHQQDAIARGSIYAPPFNSMTALSLEETGFQQHPTKGAGAVRAASSLRRRRSTTRTASMVSRMRSGSSITGGGGVAADMHIYKPAFPLLQTLLLNNNVIEGMLPHQLFSFNVMPALSTLNVENNLIVGFSSSIMNAIASRNVLSDVRCANNAFPNVSTAYTHSLATTGVMAASEKVVAAKSRTFTEMMKECEFVEEEGDDDGGGEVGEEGRLYLDKWRAKAHAAQDTESIEGCLMRVTGVYDAAVKAEAKRAKVAQNALIMQAHSEALIRESEKQDRKVGGRTSTSTGRSASEAASRTDRGLAGVAQNSNSSVLTTLPEVRSVRAIVDPTHDLSLPSFNILPNAHQGEGGGTGLRQLLAPPAATFHHHHHLPPPVMSTSSAPPTAAVFSIPSPTFTASCLDNNTNFARDANGDDIHENSFEQDVNQKPKISQVQQQQRRSHEQEKQLIMARIASLHGRLQQEVMDRGICSVDELVECLGSVRLPISVPATKTLLTSLQELVVNAAEGDAASSSTAGSSAAPHRSGLMTSFDENTINGGSGTRAAILKQRLLNQPNINDVESTSQIAPRDIVEAARAQKPIEKRLRQHIGVPRCGMCDASLVDVWCRFTRDMGLTGVSQQQAQNNSSSDEVNPPPHHSHNVDGGLTNFKAKADAARGSAGGQKESNNTPIQKRTSSRRVLRRNLQSTTTTMASMSALSLDATDRTTRSNRSSHFNDDVEGNSNVSTTVKKSSRFTPNVNHTDNSRLNADDLEKIGNASNNGNTVNGPDPENQKIPNFFDETSSEEEFDAAAAEEEAAALAAALEHSSDDSTPQKSRNQSDNEGDAEKKASPLLTSSSSAPRKKAVNTETPMRRLNRQVRRLRRHLKHMNIRRLREAKQLQYSTRKRRAAAMDHNQNYNNTHRSTSSSQPHPAATTSGNHNNSTTTLSLQRSTDLVVFIALLRQWDSLCRGIAELDNATQDRSVASTSPQSGLMSPTTLPYQQISDEASNSLSSPLYDGGGWGTGHGIMLTATPADTPTAGTGGKVPWSAPQHHHQTRKSHQHDTSSNNTQQEQQQQQQRYHSDTGIVFGFDFDKCPDGDPEADIEAQIASEKHSEASEAEKAALVATHRHKWLYRLLFSHLSKFSVYDVTPCPPFALIKPIESLVANAGGMPVGSSTTNVHEEEVNVSKVSDDNDKLDTSKTTSSSVLGGVTLDTSLLDQFTQVHKNKKKAAAAAVSTGHDDDSSEAAAAPSTNTNSNNSCQPSVIFYTCGRAECVEELIDIIAGEGDTGADYSKLAYKPTTMKLHHHHGQSRHTTTSSNKDPAGHSASSSSYPTSGINTPAALISPKNNYGGSGVGMKRPIPTVSPISKLSSGRGVEFARSDEDKDGGEYEVGSSSGFDDTTSSSIGDWEDGIDNYYPALSANVHPFSTL